MSSTILKTMAVSLPSICSARRGRSRLRCFAAASKKPALPSARDIPALWSGIASPIAAPGLTIAGKRGAGTTAATGIAAWDGSKIHHGLASSITSAAAMNGSGSDTAARSQTMRAGIIGTSQITRRWIA